MSTTSHQSPTDSHLRSGSNSTTKQKSSQSKCSLADRAPVLCYQPGEALVAHVAAKGIDAVNKAVFRNASGFAGGSKRALLQASINGTARITAQTSVCVL